MEWAVEGYTPSSDDTPTMTLDERIQMAKQLCGVMDAKGMNDMLVVPADPEAEREELRRLAETFNAHTRVVIRQGSIFALPESMTGALLIKHDLAKSVSKTTAEMGLTPRGLVMKDIITARYDEDGSPYLLPVVGGAVSLQGFIKAVRTSWERRPRMGAKWLELKYAWREWWGETQPEPFVVDMSGLDNVVLWTQADEENMHRLWVESDFLAVWNCPYGIDEGLRIRNEWERMTAVLGPNPRATCRAIEDIARYVVGVFKEVEAEKEEARIAAAKAAAEEEERRQAKIRAEYEAKQARERAKQDRLRAEKERQERERQEAERIKREEERVKALDELLQLLDSPAPKRSKVNTYTATLIETAKDSGKSKTTLTPSQRASMKAALDNLMVDVRRGDPIAFQRVQTVRKDLGMKPLKKPAAVSRVERKLEESQMKGNKAYIMREVKIDTGEIRAEKILFKTYGEASDYSSASYDSGGYDDLDSY